MCQQRAVVSMWWQTIDTSAEEEVENMIVWYQCKSASDVQKNGTFRQRRKYTVGSNIKTGKVENTVGWYRCRLISWWWRHLLKKSRKQYGGIIKYMPTKKNTWVVWYQCRLAGDEDICSTPAVVPLGRLSQSLVDRSTLYFILHTVCSFVRCSMKCTASAAAFGMSCALQCTVQSSNGTVLHFVHSAVYWCTEQYNHFHLICCNAVKWFLQVQYGLRTLQSSTQKCTDYCTYFHLVLYSI